MEVYPGISGAIGSQRSKYQKIEGRGPIPEGRYYIDLSLAPTRMAKLDNLGYTLNGNGIEKIPQGFLDDNPWGNIRARLNPLNGTNTFGRNNFYIHDSRKGHTSGCVEVPSSFFDRLLEYQENNSLILFYVNY